MDVQELSEKQQTGPEIKFPLEFSVLKSAPISLDLRIEICYSIITRKHLDFEKVVTIMAAFYSARRSMTHARLRRFARHFIILRTKNYAGAKSTPNTPFFFQEIT